MQETGIHPPRTLMEVFRMLPEGTLAELIDNRLYMSPGPIGRHQRVLRNLFLRLNEFVVSQKLGEVFFAPFDVYLDEEANAVQPDIIFISASNLHIVNDEDVIHGVPDLLIEILSPGNPEHDTVTKKNLYERFGVKEYWIVDPATKSTIGYQLEKGGYKKLNSESGKIDSALLAQSFLF